MSKKQWLVLLMLFLTYLLLGASIFYNIESRLEIERVGKAKKERMEINALLHAHYVPSQSHDHDEILGKLSRYCGKSVYNYTEGETDPLKWDFYNSFYFAYTVVSTIGYGNLAPTNMLGRILMIFYGLIGIPMNGILLTQLGEFFGRAFVKAHRKYKSYKHGRNDDYYPRKLTTFETRKVGLAAQIFVYLLPGFVMFIFFPAFLFSHYEGWNYDEAVYYAFVTLTTIGFGDYVAGQDNSKGSGVFFIFYKTFLICWISFGLGYIVMIMAFIARGMRSKKITRIEHKLATNLKHTQSKIWNEFHKEINYLRRVFNELQLSKVKRVYVDECNHEIPAAKFLRSNSFPDLRGLLYGTGVNDTITLQHRPRRRANSEVVPTEDQIARVVSETDLQRIDKTATFATHALIQPAELLAKLVNVLGYIPPATEEVPAGSGVDSNQTTVLRQDTNNRFEQNTRLSFAERETPNPWTTPKPRFRAYSEVKFHETKKNEEADEKVEWTWSDPTASTKIRELMKKRANRSSGQPPPGYDADSKQSSATTTTSKLSSKLRTSFAFAKAVPKALISSAGWKGRPFGGISEKKNLPSAPLAAAAAAATCPEDERRGSTSNSKRHYYTHTGVARNIEAGGNSNFLEETSVADFLRALTVLHANVTNNTSWFDEDHQRTVQPRRKMGTASLTPPKLPSLFTLFSSSSAEQATQQQSNGGPQSSNNTRRSSLAFAVPTVIKSRRFSLRPVATPVSPPTPPKNNSPILSNSRKTTYENSSSKSTFLFDSPKQPLIRMEGTPGFSTPIKSTSSNFTNNLETPRLSLRPNQTAMPSNAMPTGENNSSIISTLKPVPRWKAGMLQRQIGQMNLRRRVRAFSLTDVYGEEVKEKGTHQDFSNYKKNNRDVIRKNAAFHEPSTITDHEPISNSDQSRCSSSRLEDQYFTNEILQNIPSEGKAPTVLRSDPTNGSTPPPIVPPLYSQFNREENRCDKCIASGSLRSFQNDTQPLSIDLPTIQHAVSSASADTKSIEVKVFRNSTHNSLPRILTGTSQTSSRDFTEINIEQQGQSDKPSNNTS